MTDINPIARPPHAALNGISRLTRQDPGADTAARTGDRVELSTRAKYLSKLKQLPEVREGLVQSVKAQIAAGNYDTPERFDTAVNAMLDDLF